VNLIDYYYKKYKMGPIDAIAKTLVRVRGSYALAIMFRDYPEQVYIARKDNPLIVGLGEGENFIASDPSACLKYTRRVCYIDNFEMGCVTKDSVTFYDLNGDVVEKTPVLIDWDETAAEKGGYEHFMMKEIHEQPKAIADTAEVFRGGGFGQRRIAQHDLRKALGICRPRHRRKIVRSAFFRNTRDIAFESAERKRKFPPALPSFKLKQFSRLNHSASANAGGSVHRFDEIEQIIR